MDDQQTAAPTTQAAHQRRLAAMYRQDYRTSHPHCLRKALFAYFVFLEQAIAGKPTADCCACAEDDFTIAELEALNRYQEALLRRGVPKSEQR